MAGQRTFRSTAERTRRDTSHKKLKGPAWRDDAARLRPMLAELADPSTHEVWIRRPDVIFEPKYDGIRALVEIDPGPVGRVRRAGDGVEGGDGPSRPTRPTRPVDPAASAKPLTPSAQRLAPSAKVRIWSRNGNEKTHQFPELAAEFARLAASLDGPLLVDGEIVALDDESEPTSFGHLQSRIHLTGARPTANAVRIQPVAFIAFDLLRDGDEDLRPLPFRMRRQRLERRFRGFGSGRLRLIRSVRRNGRALWEEARRHRREGIVVKEPDSPYFCGRRSPAWHKLKLFQEQDFVVGGWTDPRQSRQHFGALLLGYFTPSPGLRPPPAPAAAAPGPPARQPRWGGTSASASRGAAARGWRAPRALREEERDGVRGPQRQVPSGQRLIREAPPERLAPSAYRLIYVGSVGSGFDERELERVSQVLHALATDDCPFTTRPDTLERAHWIRPELVVRVKFAEWTVDRRLRAPVYLGLRDDVSPHDVQPELTPGPSMQPRARRRRSIDKPARLPQGDPAIEALLDRLQDLEDRNRDGVLELPDGPALKVTNLRKVFWSQLKITKGELLRYYVRVAPLILPAVADRPLVMKRFPNGITGEAFYQQRAPDDVPDGVRVEYVSEQGEPLGRGAGDEILPRLIGGSLMTLLYMTQLAAISQDPWFSRAQSPLDADYAALDLDPQPGVTFAQVLDVARWIGAELDRLGVPSVPKTSGSRGLHIYIPLPAGTSYDSGQIFCQIIATMIATRHPQEATVERTVSARGKTVYVDYLQNIVGKTLATAYSARATEFAGVSTPLTWTEVDEGVDPRDFTVRSVPDRLRSVGDVWARLRAGKPANLRAALKKISGRLGRT